MKRGLGVLLLVLLLLPARGPETYIDGWSIGGITMANISDTACRHLQNQEGLRLQAYDDATGKPLEEGEVSRGVATIGYGHTGPEVKSGLRITREWAEELFRRDLVRFEKGVENALARPATQNQFDAMVCLAYNIGLGYYKDEWDRKGFRGSSLLAKFNRGDIKGAAAEFGLYVYGRVNGKLVVMDGLVRRRKIERAMFEGRGTATLASR